MLIKVGCDVGNFDTKTQLTSTASSYSSYEKEPLIANELLVFEGKYFVPSFERNNQMQDKTVNDYSTIMTLFGVAKEILAQATNNCMTADVIQKKVSEVSNVKLGVGLPVGYFSKLAQPTLAYYNKRFNGTVSFDYSGSLTKNRKVHFDLVFDQITIYPQDVVAVIKNPDLSIPRKYKDYNIIGIGGGTLDYIPVRNGMPQVQDVVSKDAGTTQMFTTISAKLQQNGFSSKDNLMLEKVIRGEATILDKESRKAEKDFIIDCVRAYSDKMVDDLVHDHKNLNDYPVVFIGGGALLIKEHLEANEAFAETEFVKSVNENAIYYAKAV